MRILVTGSAGYIGSVMVPFLLERGHTVTGLDIGYFAEARFIPLQAAIPEIKKDLRDVHRLDLQDIDAVIHLAALSNDPLGQLNPELTLEINHRATVRLAAAAKAAGVRRFIYSSSCSLYGAGGSALLDESAAFSPQTAYAQSKVFAERDLARLADEGFSITYMRNATVYGVSPRMRFDLVVNNLAGYAWTTKQVRILSDGTPWRPLVHVRDLCGAFVAVLEAPTEVVNNQAYNVGQECENFQVRDIAELVGKEFEGSTIVYGGRGDPDSRTYRVSFQKLHKTFPDLEFQWNLERGVFELHQTFQATELSHEAFQQRRYNRLKQLQFLRQSGQISDNFCWCGPQPRSLGTSVARIELT